MDIFYDYSGYRPYNIDINIFISFLNEEEYNNFYDLCIKHKLNVELPTRVKDLPIKNMKQNDNTICLISRSIIEKGDRYVKCKNNHCYSAENYDKYNSKKCLLCNKSIEKVCYVNLDE